MPTSIPETTLSNPLTDASYDEFLRWYVIQKQKPNTEVARLALLLRNEPHCPDASLVVRHESSDNPALSTIGLRTVPVDVVSTYLQEAGDVVMAQWTSIRENLRNISVNGNAPPLPAIPLTGLHRDPRLLGDFQQCLYWLNVVDAIVTSTKVNKWKSWEGGWFSRRLSLIPLGGKYRLLTTDACLMFKDMMYSRFLIHLYCRLDGSRFNLSYKLDQFIAWGANVLERYGNFGYELIKGIEALSQTALIRREERILDGEKQHKDMIAKYIEKERNIGGNGELIQELISHLDTYASSRDLAEALGFMKLWGHPYVDPRAGAKSAKEHGQRDNPTSLVNSLKLEWSFCHIYCRGYIRKYSRWPPMRFTLRDGKPSKLQRLYDRNQPALAFGFTQYDPSDWHYAEFEKHLSFDYGEDILSLVVDKSLSYERENFDATWQGRLPYAPPKPTKSSRVLEELIRRPEIDLPAIVQRVSQRDIPHAWRIVTVAPKEREMKLQPRMFSMMVLEMRLFFVLSEHNIATGIFKNLPEQTMTLSRNELLNLFLQSTSLTPGTWVRAVVGIDFARWNLYWRKDTVHPIGRRMNTMYGVEGVFDVVHDFFQACMCLLRLQDYPPDHLNAHNRHAPPESDTLWYDHQGGFEGIAQKLWTTCTIALVHMCLWHLGLSYRIIGQGDNQVCILNIYIPTHYSRAESIQHVRQLVDDATSSIEETSLEVGQVVKKEECIQSTCFMIYGKEMILHGAYLPTSLKYISRMFPSTTSDAPSVYEMFSSISSGAAGATERNDWSFPTYFLAKMIEGITWIRETRKSLFHDGKLRDEVTRLTGEIKESISLPPRHRELLELAIAIPSNLGGLPITTISELLHRGHPDPLNSSLFHLCMLSGVPSVKNYQRVLRKGWVLQEKPDLLGLIQDPYAIPLRTSVTPASSVARVTSSILPDVTRNAQFSELYDRATPADRDTLVQWLTSLRPFYPKIAHDLYKSSLIGVRDSFSKRFTNTRTILAISKRAEIDVTGTSLSADYTYLTDVMYNFHLTWKVDPSSVAIDLSRLYFLAKAFRKKWTGEDLEGVTTAHPLAVGKLHWIPLVPVPDVHTPQIVAMSFQSSSAVCNSTRGGVNPYLGSSTGGKTVDRWVRPVDSSPPLRDVLKILTIRSMTALPDSPFYEGLTRLAQSRSRLDVDQLETLLKIKIGGTLAHRYQMQDDAGGSYWNSCFNWPSHITMSTNLSGDLGRDDYPFSYQQAMLCMSTLASWYWSTSNQTAPWGVILTVDLNKMETVADQVVESKVFLPRQSAPSSNYYAMLQEVQITSHAATAARFQRENLNLPWTVARSPLHDAIAMLSLYRIRGSQSITTHFGYTFGIPSHHKMIDLPEVAAIDTETMLQALRQAFWMKIGLSLTQICGWKKRKPAAMFQQMLDLEIRRSVPGLAGTLREIDAGSPTHGLGIGLGKEGEMNSLYRWMHLLMYSTGEYAFPQTFTLYDKGSASLSSQLSAYLGVLSAKECLSGDPIRFRNGKLVGNLVSGCLRMPDEMARVRWLIILIRVLRCEERFSVSQKSPEEVTRELRAVVPTRGAPTRTRVTRLYTPPTMGTQTTGGTALSQFLTCPLLPEELYESWRTTHDVSARAAERWAVVGDVLGRANNVLLLGVGQGSVGDALPPHWHVTGVEKAVELQSLGHHFTTYQPPGMGGRFTLHPMSWTLGGDVFDEKVQAELLTELRTGKYDAVLIDVENDDNSARLLLRSRLAETGVPALCKILLADKDVPLFLASWQAYCQREDVLWTTLSYPGREFIVGSSSAPIGVYVAVPDPTMTLTHVPVPTRHDYEVIGYEEYMPGPDLLTLIGCQPPLIRGSITGGQCRALFPFVTYNHTPRYPFQDVKSACIHLLRNQCPRSRVRAVINLYLEGYLHLQFPAQLAQIEYNS